MLIRRAVDGDVEALFALRAEVGNAVITSLDPAASSRHSMSIVGMFRDSAAAGWIAAEGDQCIGFVIARAGMGDVYLLLVHPLAIGRGVGTRLLAEAERWLYNEGVRRAWLAVRGQSASRTRAFYQKSGWHTTENYEGSRVLYSKNLVFRPESAPTTLDV